METIEIVERFAELMSHDNIKSWRDQVFQLSQDLGYERTLLAIFPSQNTSIEVDNAFLQTSYPYKWLDKYDEERMGEVDPVVSHCQVKSTPLIWTPDIFALRRQHDLYEEACSYGIRSGVTLPIHGINGELGILCFATDSKPDEHFEREALRNIPELSCLRDFIFETSSRFMKKRPALTIDNIELTSREVECLKWCASGKSSWDIAQLLNCTEATVNYHFTNVRRKFGTSSRRLAVIKAMRLGFITL